MIVSTDEGVVYTLRYGEVVFASGEELSAGTEERPKEAGQGQATKKKAEGATENRYLMVTVAFDPTLVPGPRTRSEASSSPTTRSRRPPTTPSGSPRRRPPRRRTTARRPTATSSVADGREEVKELTDRFADWYYVTPGDSFHAIALEQRRADPTQSQRSQRRPRRPSFSGAPNSRASLMRNRSAGRCPCPESRAWPDPGASQGC